MKQKHHALIIAWANGAKIEQRFSKKWIVADQPQWYKEYEYRIKPVAKPCPEKMQEYLNALLFLCALNNTDTPLATKESILQALEPKEET